MCFVAIITVIHFCFPGEEVTGVGQAPSVYLREDPICGTQLENQRELRATNKEMAAYYLDYALMSRTSTEEEGRSSHLLFTLHVYQYRIEKANRAGLPGGECFGSCDWLLLLIYSKLTNQM